MNDDPRFATNSDRVKHRDLVDQAIGAWFSSRNRDAALAEMRSAGATVGPVFNIADAMADPHVLTPPAEGAAPAGRRRRTAAIKSPKAATADACRRLDQLPNVGPAMADDLRLIGIHDPAHLKGEDPLTLYRRLCEITGRRHDPCVLDTFLAIVDFMSGAAPAPWWAYTPQRKVRF
ncbi:MAG: hypothetical protein M1823_006644, partial [Watsoniomyces obsoletus]